MICHFFPITFVTNLNYTQRMKKLFALAFVAGMVAFASCTSKPAEEAADTTAVSVESMEVDTMAIDTMAADTTVSAE